MSAWLIGGLIGLALGWLLSSIIASAYRKKNAMSDPFDGICDEDRQWLELLDLALSSDDVTQSPFDAREKWKVSDSWRVGELHIWTYGAPDKVAIYHDGYRLELRGHAATRALKALDRRMHERAMRPIAEKVLAQ